MKRGNAMLERIRSIFSLLLLAPLLAVAQNEGPVLEVFTPKAEKAPVVVLLSGASGPASYRYFGEDLARLGYFAVLVHGNTILRRSQEEGAQNLRSVIAKAQASPNALPGKVFVVGFSMGGGGAIAHASTMPEL